MNYHYSGNFFVLIGSDKKVSLYSRDLELQAELHETNEFSKAAKFRSNSMELAITTEPGYASVFELENNFKKC